MVFGSDVTPISILIRSVSFSQAVHIDASNPFISTPVNGLVVHLVHIENYTLSAGENAPSSGERTKKKKP